jgi:hypothetical protein
MRRGIQELDTSFENVIVVDNLPVVPPEKVEKLIGALSITFLSLLHMSVGGPNCGNGHESR